MLARRAMQPSESALKELASSDSHRIVDRIKPSAT
jgi:hypothetical protein